MLQTSSHVHSSSTRWQIHKVDRLEAEQSAKLGLKLYPRFNLREIADEINVDRKAAREEFVEGLQKHKLLQLVGGHPGVLVRGKVYV